MPCNSSDVYLQQEVLDSTTMEPTKRITEESFETKLEFCDGRCSFVGCEARRRRVAIPKEESPEVVLPPSPVQREGAPSPAEIPEYIPIDAAPGTTGTDPATGEGQGGIILERLQRVEALLENLLQRLG
ncbi:hypothetical protein EXIGLDRAFT_781439 [Exidia glandulosa HHB12029]|uniref:Uncharacterized protein n=1 Tax=Exidia glandulosa HHB12029 TaxID=1314781 RepID=A0A165B8Z5_EXIGL|nr:hypothetical protein EXIGLDRAFT_781439 [Exidia glandulosa HHB12029]